MGLREELEKQGNWLFRWRSYLPLLILPILLVALQDSGYLERHFGRFADTLWENFCLAVSFLGLLIRCITVGYAPEKTSGRNTKRQVAKTLNTTGMYSLMRHPLYFGNFIIMLGIAMLVEVWWFVVIFILAFWLYYERIMFAEEEFLRERFGPAYQEWAEKTPLFLPQFSLWRSPPLPFSFKTVLKREYPGLFGIIVTFTLLDTLADLFVEGRLEMEPKWVILFSVGFAVYLTLMILKKKTKFLSVKEGR